MMRGRGVVVLTRPADSWLPRAVLAQDARCAAVGNRLMSAPVSVMMLSARVVLIPGNGVITTQDHSPTTVERYNAQAERTGFHLLLATDDVSVAAFADGFTFPTDLWWRGALSPAPARAEAASRYAVIELVVARRARGARPVARAHAAPARRPRRRSSDPSHQTWLPGHAIYQRWGWRIVGQVQSYPTWPVDEGPRCRAARSSWHLQRIAPRRTWMLPRLSPVRISSWSTMRGATHSPLIKSMRRRIMTPLSSKRGRRPVLVGPD